MNQTTKSFWESWMQWRQKGFNPSQARDAIGRWASNQGGSGQRSALPRGTDEEEQNYSTLRDRVEPPSAAAQEQLSRWAPQGRGIEETRAIAAMALGKKPKMTSWMKKADKITGGKYSAALKEAAGNISSVIKEQGITISAEKLTSHVPDLINTLSK